MASAVVAKRTYYRVFIALYILLVATVLVHLAHWGELGTGLSLAIASAKALLVALYFMHIRYSSPLMRLFSIVGLVWLAILIGATLTDYLTRH